MGVFDVLMIRHHLARHHYKIVVGVPVLVLLASSLSFVRDPDQVWIDPDNHSFVEVGEAVRLHITAHATEPINVVGATVAIPTDRIVVDSLSKEGSVIDLWSEEPTQNGSTIHFSGGMLDRLGFQGTGILLTLVIHPTKPGDAVFAFHDVHMLAHDGTGREVQLDTKPITLAVRSRGASSPDVNGDNHVNILDLGLVSAKIFLGYRPLYDLNGDGKVSLADLLIIFNIMTRDSELGSLVLRWNS